MSSDRTVLVTTRSFGSGDADPVGELEAAGLVVERGDTTHDPGALAEPLARASAWIAGTAPIGADLLGAAPGLKVIARAGTGTDAVDLAAAAARGVVVTNTPGANAASVADHAVGLMLAALRGTVAGDAVVRDGGWKAPVRGRELGALTVGIVGFGAIGRGVARRVAGGFGARVVAFDPYVAPDAEAHGRPAATFAGDAAAFGAGRAAAELMPLDAVLAEADVLTLHAPGGDAPLIDAAALARMRPGAVLVNTARGTLLDEDAVADALRSGRLAAVAADVLAAEPATASPLLHAPNVIVTPHAAATTVQAIDRMGMGAAAEVLRVLRGEAPANPVPAPQESPA